MNEKILKDIAIAINSNFTEDFGFPDGFIRATVNLHGNLCLFIGSRDIEMNPNGKVVGSGSGSECWKIEHS